MAGIDQGLQNFIQQETEKQRFQTVLHEITEKCWDTCFDMKPSTRVESKTETCLKNCVERFIDTNVLITQRIEKKAQEMMSSGSGSFE
ncbi:mitochondrial import inner membrane translocase subunit Tim8 A-like [Eurytemora carolleeae]|uniref:mitochondrial import inner membrane translocase subunit Tim8 A-like n=1 Tax=Eurytemora carolleeae TaxID=1294199 RepID=UPI000C788FD8|nr:mitochondrial import inner membrane translocase subunit Tim8 A-like [Eurytemora carolleeae]|eukprot:XP_023346758.1 mitochondrial import inner membrane translocase subunit Tim8 A-like [Eurytemora affinis]